MFSSTVNFIDKPERLSPEGVEAYESFKPRLECLSSDWSLYWEKLRAAKKSPAVSDVVALQQMMLDLIRQTIKAHHDVIAFVQDYAIPAARIEAQEADALMPAFRAELDPKLRKQGYAPLDSSDQLSEYLYLLHPKCIEIKSKINAKRGSLSNLLNNTIQQHNSAIAELEAELERRNAKLLAVCS